MNQFYEVEGQKYEVGEDKLPDFLLDFPNALRVEVDVEEEKEDVEKASNAAALSSVPEGDPVKDGDPPYAVPISVWNQAQQQRAPLSNTADRKQNVERTLVDQLNSMHNPEGSEDGFVFSEDIGGSEAVKMEYRENGEVVRSQTVLLRGDSNRTDIGNLSSVQGYSDYLEFVQGIESDAADEEAVARADANAETFMLSNDKAIEKKRQEILSRVYPEGQELTEEEVEAELLEYESNLERSRTGGFLSKKRGKNWKETPTDFYKRITPVESRKEFFRKSKGDNIAVEEDVLTIDGISRRSTASDASPGGYYMYYKTGPDGSMVEATVEDRNLFYANKFHHEQRVVSDLTTESLLEIDNEISGLSVAGRNVMGGSAVAGEGVIFTDGQEAALDEQRTLLGKNIEENGTSAQARYIRTVREDGDDARADMLLEREIDRQLDLNTSTQSDSAAYVADQQDVVEANLRERYNELLADGTLDAWSLAKRSRGQESEVMSFEEFAALPENDELFAKVYNESQKDFYVENQRGFDDAVAAVLAPNEDGEPNELIASISAKAQEVHQEEYDATRAAVEDELNERFNKKYYNITRPIQIAEEKRLMKEIQNGEFVGTKEEIDEEYRRRVLAKYESNKRLQNVSERHEKALNKALIPVNEKVNNTFQELVNQELEPIREEYADRAQRNHNIANAEFINLWQGGEDKLIPKEKYAEIFNTLNAKGFGAFNTKNKRAAILLEWQALEASYRSTGEVDEAGIAKRKKEYYHSMWEQLAYNKDGGTTVFNDRSTVISMMDDLEAVAKKRKAGGEDAKYSGVLGELKMAYDGIVGTDWKDYLTKEERRTYADGVDALKATENMNSSGVKNFFMGMGSTNVIDWVPIASDIVDLGDSIYIKSLLDRQLAHQKNPRKNKPLTKSETNLLLMRKYKDMSKSHAASLSNAYTAGNGMPSSVKLMGEMALMYATAGSSSLITRGVLMSAKRKFVKKGLSFAARRSALTPSKFTTKALDTLTQSFVTSLAGTPRVVSESYKGMTPEMEFAYSQEGEEWIQAIRAGEPEGNSWGKELAKAFGNNWVETFTEKFGAHIPGIKNSLVGKLTPKEWEDISLSMFMGRYLRKKGIKPGGQAGLKKFKEMVGFDGLISEVLEEFIAQPPQNLIDGNDLFTGMDQDFVEQTLISTGAMTIAFGGLGVGSNVINKMNGSQNAYYWVDGASYATAEQAKEAVQNLKDKNLLKKDTQIEISYDADALSDINSIVKGTPMENRVQNTDIGLEVVDVAKAVEIEANNSLSLEERTIISENKARLEEIKLEQDENAAREKELVKSNQPVAKTRAEKRKLRKELAATQAEARELQSENNALLSPIVQKLTKARTEKGYDRLVKKVRAFAQKLDPNLSVVEVKTQEELGSYVGVSEKNKALKTHGVKVSVDKKGKETYTDIKTGKTITKAELAKREIDIDKINTDSDNYLKSQGDLSQVHGTILDLNDGTSVIVLNKTASINLGAKNVASHEWLHRVLNKTFLNNPQTALAVGRSLDRYIRNMNPSAIANSKLRARISNYQKTQGEIVSAEETLNVFSDAIANGEIVFNENMFTRVGDTVRRAFSAMGVKVKFNEAQDVFNFIRDYNRTMENTNKSDNMSRGLRRTMAEGANIGGQIKYESDAYNTLLEETGLRTPTEKSITKSSDVAKLVDKYDGNHKKMIRKAAAQAPDGRSVFDINVRPDKHGNTPVLIESEFGQEIMPIVETTTKRLFDGIPENIASDAGVSRRSFQNDLIAEASAIVQNEYDPSKQEIDKFISNRLNLRANSLAERLGIPSADQGASVSLDQQVEGARKFDIAADDTSMNEFEEQDMSIQGRGREVEVEQAKRYVDTVNLDPESKQEIDTVVSNAAIDVNGLGYKDVKKLTTGVNAPLSRVLDITAAQFGVDPKRIVKPSDLNGKQRTAAQQYIKDNTQALMEMLPEGETRSGIATGVANTKLGDFYVKGGRGSYAGGATAAGKPTQTKRSDLTQEEFRGMFGIKPDGTFDTKKKNDGAIKALVNQAAIITANQAIRENAMATGSHSEASVALLGDGRSQAMFSKDVKPENQEAYNESYPALISEVGSANVRDLESIQLAAQRVFGGKGLSVAEINKIAKSIYNQTIEYDRIKSEHETGVGARRVDMDQTIGEFLENNFKSEQLDSSIISILEKLGLPKDVNGKTIAVGTHFLDIDRINSRREDVVLLGNRMVDAGMSINEVAQTLVAIYGGMAKDAGKIADGRFIVVNGVVQLDPKWEDHKVDGKMVPGRKWKRESKGPNKGKLKKNANGNRVAQDNRRQAFASTADFIAQLQKIKGLESLSNPSQGVYKLNNSVLETRLIPESSAAFVKDPKFEGRKIQAERSRGVVEMILDMAFEKIDAKDGGYDYADLAMILTSLGGQMTSPMRRSAYAEYTMVGIEDVIANAKKNGVSVGSVTEYEHSIPQAEMTLRVLNSYLKNGKLDPKVWDGYKVAVISKAMDTVLIENGYRKRSPIDGKPRYYNTKTFRDPNIKPLRSHDPSKKGTPAEFVGQGFVEAGRVMGETGKASQQDLIALSNAYRGIRLSRGVPKGITVLDFDDTLATTKSNVLYTMPSDSQWEFRADGNLYKVSRGTNGTLKIINNKTGNLVSNKSPYAKLLSYHMMIERGASEQELEKAAKRMFFRGEVPTGATLRKAPGQVSASNKLTAEEFAKQGSDLLAEGAVFDFSEFDKVVDGKVAPLFEKAMKLYGKFGSKDMFILTARSPASAPAIKQFLDSQGLNIPIENITGLGKSEASAKAQWISDKIGEGYNDFYFADDAIQNVEAVRDMLDQSDVKGKVQQARLRFSREAPGIVDNILDEAALDLDSDFNIVLEESKNVGRQKRFSPAKARQRGKNKGKFKFFIPPSADDFAGLCYSFLGKGKQGDKHKAWFKEHLFDPFSKGIRSINGMKNLVAAEIKALKKSTPGSRALLKSKPSNSEFTNEQAVRVYNWIKAGFMVPGLSTSDAVEMMNRVEGDPTLKSFAEGLSTILQSTSGVAEPGNAWLGGTINSDANDALEATRQAHLAEWKHNKDIIFSEENLNKIEAVYGSNFREALEDILYRMETGSTQNRGKDRLLNNFTAWIHGSIGTTMFFNSRSAILQLISWVNFINWSENNPLAAAKAFANQKQYWSDVAMIFNSPYLKQRRSGLKTDLNANELLNAVKDSKNPMKALISHLLSLGFTPTQVADSAAIAIGGATFYRNRIKTYQKEGVVVDGTRVFFQPNAAEKQAFEDMMEIAEETQQSARPDRISQQQASPLGKFILAFQNTPMQMNRLMKKAAQDLVNGRGDAKSNVSRIIYYGTIQSAIFYGMQTLIFESLMGGDDDGDEKLEKKKSYMMNGMLDSLLRGAGMGGAVVATLKNVILEFLEQEEKEQDDNWMSQANHAYTILEALNVSPPIGIKARKLYGAAQTWDFNRDIIDHMDKTSIDNPMYDAVGSVVEATANVPLSRLYNKVQNIREAMDSDNETWKRVAMFLGWSRWTLGAKNQAVLDAKGEVKEIKKEAAKEKAEMKKVAKEIERQAQDEIVEESNLLEQEEERERGEKDIKCAAVSRSGKRCGKKVKGGGNYCTIHEGVPQRANGEKTQCTHVKGDGNRCKMKTTNQSGKCYYHD